MVLSKIKRTSGWLAANWNKTFFPCNNHGNNTTLSPTDRCVSGTCFSKQKTKTLLLQYKAQRTQSSCQLTKTYFRYYEAWGSVFSCEKLNRCFFWHKVRSFQFRCQQTKTCFPYDKGSKAKFDLEKKEKPALRNIMLQTVYLSKKQTKTLFWVKSTKIKVTRCKLADNLFPVQ